MQALAEQQLRLMIQSGRCRSPIKEIVMFKVRQTKLRELIPNRVQSLGRWQVPLNNSLISFKAKLIIDRVSSSRIWV